MDLRGKAALVTGGTMGLGEAIADKLVAAGANVAITARESGPHVDALLARWRARGVKAEFLPGDVGKQADCRAAVEGTIRAFGRIDVLVCNAGGPNWGKIEDLSAEQWQAAMDVHVNGPFHLCQAALPDMRKRKEGAILTVASAAAIRGVPGGLAYATAKGALLNFTRSLARDLAEDNVRVNCVAPGVIRTRFHATMTEERRLHNLEHRIPLKREGTPEQVAAAAMALIENDYITGETLVIDGGLTSRIA